MAPRMQWAWPWRSRPVWVTHTTWTKRGTHGGGTRKSLPHRPRPCPRSAFLSHPRQEHLALATPPTSPTISARGLLQSAGSVGGATAWASALCATPARPHTGGPGRPRVTCTYTASTSQTHAQRECRSAASSPSWTTRAFMSRLPRLSRLTPPAPACPLRGMTRGPIQQLSALPTLRLLRVSRQAVKDDAAMDSITRFAFTSDREASLYHLHYSCACGSPPSHKEMRQYSVCLATTCAHAWKRAMPSGGQQPLGRLPQHARRAHRLCSPRNTLPSPARLPRPPPPTSAPPSRP